MPVRRKTRGEEFIEFMQERLGEPVDVPVVATDVLRTVKFPGLEQRTAEEQAPDLSQFQMPEGGFQPQEPMPAPTEMLPDAPAGDFARQPLMEDDEELF